MKICFDVNIVIDLMTQSDWIDEAVASYDIANLLQFDVFIPACSLSDIEYLLHRRGLNSSQTYEAMEQLFQLFDIVDTTGADGYRAHCNKMKDFEDALIAESCARNGIDFILTRNQKDFLTSPVRAISPKDFVRIYKPANYEFGSVEL